MEDLTLSNTKTAIRLRSSRKVLREKNGKRMYKDFTHEEKMEMGRYRIKMNSNLQCMDKYNLSIFYMKKINRYYRENV